MSKCLVKKCVPLLLSLFSPCLFNTVCAQRHTFPADFAPTENIVKPQEAPYRDAVCLNGSWSFYPIAHAEQLEKEKLTHPDYPVDVTWEQTKIKIPSPWNVNNFATEKIAGGDFVTYPSYPKKWEDAKAGWLMRQIPYHKEWKNKRLILRFEAVGGYTQVFVNKQKAGENFDVFLPFEIDVTNLIKENKLNELAVWVADGQLLNRPGRLGRRVFVAGSFWGQHIRGIWQDVNLIAKPLVHIENTFINAALDSDLLHITATVNNTSSKTKDITISGMVTPWINLAGKTVLTAPEPKWTSGAAVIDIPEKKISIAPGSAQKVEFTIKIKGRLKSWTTEHPNLYGVTLTTRQNKNTTDRLYTRFGWRQFSLAGNKFYLNGKPIILKGDSWHFMGIPQMTRRYVWGWFKALQDAHANAVRLHAEPYPAFYLDMADEMGICVLDETGMWASDGGPKIDDDAYWARSEDHLKRFILRDRNHPAVFGWSVCNENLPVTIGVLHSPDSVVKRQIDEINKWVKITRQLDPSRNWISGDGETQSVTDLPTVIGHYGDENAYKNWSSQGKVWGIGESGMAYYGTPLQTSFYNGNRSFESQEGRMEGVALEAQKLLNLQKKYHSSYYSIFNIIWYGLQPLELGLNDVKKAPAPTDGIFFKPYQEGKPGIQPERLGPYTTTLNPGYDPTLPLYRKWPLFDAIKAAFSDTAQTNIQIAQKDNQIAHQQKQTVTTVKSVVLLSADRDSSLYKICAGMGITIATQPAKDDQTLLIIDGIHPPDSQEALTLQKRVSKNGGKVLIWGADPSALPLINQYLPQPVKLTTRQATSFIVKTNDPFLSELGNKDFYFSEIITQPMMLYGVESTNGHKDNVLLEANNTDWNTWNKQAEYLKTAAVLRSEREEKQAGNALIAINGTKNPIYFLTLDPALLYQSSFGLVKTLFSNLGVSFQIQNNNDRVAVNANGELEKALILASFDIAGKSAEELRNADLPGNPDQTDYYPGKMSDNHTWEQIASTQGVFNFSQTRFKGPRNNAAAYLSFWVYSPRSLSNLLLEPDMPRIDMYLNSEDSYQVILNKNIIAASSPNLAAGNKPAVKAVPLEKGWNHFIIKSFQKDGEWKLRISFKCDKKDFFRNEIKSQTYY